MAEEDAGENGGCASSSSGEITYAVLVQQKGTSDSADATLKQQEGTPARQRKKLPAVAKRTDLSTSTSSGRTKWSSQLGSQSSAWGGAGEPFYPTPQQLCRQVDSLQFEHELLNAEYQADAAARTAAAVDENKRLAATTGFSGGPGPLATRTQAQTYMTWAREQRQQAKLSRGEDSTVSERHEMTQLDPAPAQALSTSSAPSLALNRSMDSATPGKPGKKKRYEPAKVVGADGKVRLRGVKSTSDITRYCKDVDPYSKKSWAIREAFKQMRSEEHARTASTTWGALRSWYSTDKSLDEWYSGAKGNRIS